MFWTPKGSITDKSYVFSSYKQRNKVCLVDIECKMQEYRYGWWIFKLQCQEPPERSNLQTSKQKQNTVDFVRC